MSIDRTPKLYIGGKQRRAPDGGYPATVYAKIRRLLVQVPVGKPQGYPQRCRSGTEWGKAGPRQQATCRAKFLYYMAENLSARAPEHSQQTLEIRLQGGKISRTAEV